MGRVTFRRPRSLTKPSWIATATASDVSAEPAQAVTAPPKMAPSLNAGGLLRLVARLSASHPYQKGNERSKPRTSFVSCRPSWQPPSPRSPYRSWWAGTGGNPPPTVDVPAVGKQVVGLLRDQWNTSDALREYGITVD